MTDNTALIADVRAFAKSPHTTVREGLMLRDAANALEAAAARYERMEAVVKLSYRFLAAFDTAMDYADSYFDEAAEARTEFANALAALDQELNQQSSAD